jgi:hypothetical protein
MDSGASFDAANDFAKRTADNTMYVYERAFKPAWMQGKTARAVTQFKYFQLATTAKLFVLATQANSNISASPEVKAQARKELQYMVGMSMLLGGAMGSIPGGAALGLAQLIKNAFGDDDEPANYKGQLTKALGDIPGGDALLYGVFGALGGDVSGRIGLADVVWPFPDPPAGLHGSALAEWGLNAGAGAGWSMITSLFRGYDKLINEGDVPGALKEASPKAVKDVMRAIEVATEGYKTGTGKVMAGAERFELTDLLYLTVGIMPSEATRAGMSYRAMKYTDTKLDERKAELIGNVLDAIERGDREDTLAARKELSALGRKNPGLLKHGDVGRAWDRERKKQAGTQTRSEKRVTSQYGY